jgi:hypothetical protein
MEQKVFAAKVVLDSVAANGRRLISVEARYWRAIHSEIMTHRDRARSAMSSRAIPFIRIAKAALKYIPPGSEIKGKGPLSEISTDPDEIYEYIVPNCTYSYIKNDAYFPQFVGQEIKGMQAGEELPAAQRADFYDLSAELRDKALASCKRMWELGVHKSIINRYLEPWSYITVLMTATEWKNFFRLRIHKKAERHFNLIATMIRDEIQKSEPTPVQTNAWHMPYLRPEDRRMEGYFDLSTSDLKRYGNKQIELLKRVSAGRCARLSYLTHDGIRSPVEDLKVFDKLVSDDADTDVIHAAALEHVGQAAEDSMYQSGPFKGWKQFRKEFSNENVEG